MGKVKNPLPVKAIVGLIFGEDSPLSEIRGALVEKLGPVDLESRLLPFDHTDYYTRELGSDLSRLFFSFRQLMGPEELAEIKLWTNELERTYAAASGRRTANVDPGYLEASKLVLATTKNYSHRIYLGRGIYAEVTLRYRNGTFEPLEWTYPDYREGEHIEFFNRARDRYMRLLSHETYF